MDKCGEFWKSRLSLGQIHSTNLYTDYEQSNNRQV